MDNFVFHLPTKILFGKDTHLQVGKLAAEYGNKVMILYGSERIAKNGFLDQIKTLLEAENIEVYCVGGIVENPDVQKAEEIKELIDQYAITLLLAVGGGSIIDTAKAASMRSKENVPIWDYYKGNEAPAYAIPIGCILTMAATASEANCVSVLSNPKTREKKLFAHPMLYPKFSILNPEFTYTVPAKQTAIGGIDIFAHAFERYFFLSRMCTLRDKLCNAIMQTVVAELPQVLANPEDYDSRSQIMWAATMAHSDIIGDGGVFACHEMSHVLTEEYNLPHGMALGILMPAWLKFILPYHSDVLAKFAKDVWGMSGDSGSDTELAQEGIFKLQSFIGSCGLPITLTEAGVTQRNASFLARKLLKDRDYVGEAFEKIGLKEAQIIFQFAE